MQLAAQKSKNGRPFEVARKNPGIVPGKVKWRSQ